jgi:hypothetical protein
MYGWYMDADAAWSTKSLFKAAYDLSKITTL